MLHYGGSSTRPGGSLSLAAPQANRASQEQRYRRAANVASGDREFWDREAEKCRADVCYFIDRYCKIEDKRESALHGINVLGADDEDLFVGGAVPFELWPAQRKALEAIRSSKRSVVLKARQLGLTWLCLADALHVILFRATQEAIVYSQTEKLAMKAVDRARFMYDHLPVPLKTARTMPRPTGNALGSLRFSNGSTLEAFAATKGAGRSYTASFVLIDEMAHMDNAKHVVNAAQYATEATGRLVCLSTANGTANAYAKIWKQAEAGKSDYRAIFLPWWSRPDRDHAWYEEQVRNAEDPGLIAQELPSTPDEAFVASDDLRFPPSWIAIQRTTERPHGLSVEKWPDRLRDLDLTAWGLNGTRSDRRLDLYRGVLPNRRIVLAADTAVGLERGDYDAAVALDLDSREEIARVRGKWEADQYADLLCEVAVALGATLVVERNNESGGAVLMAVAQRAKRYAEYEARGHHAEAARYAVPAVGRGLDGRPGWVTNAATRPQMMALLARGLRDAFQAYGPHAITLHSPDLIAELGALRRNEKGRPEAPEGGHDDCVLALCVALGFAYLKPKPGRAAAGGDSPAGNWRRLGA